MDLLPPTAPNLVFARETYTPYCNLAIDMKTLIVVIQVWLGSTNSFVFTIPKLPFVPICIKEY